MQTDTTLDLVVLDALDWQPACESEFHETRQDTHAGPAAFFVHYYCPACKTAGSGFRCALLVKCAFLVKLLACTACGVRIDLQEYPDAFTAVPLDT